MKTLIDSIYKRMFLNDKGDFSLTKTGLNIAAVGGGILALPTTFAAAGIAIALPPVAIATAKLCVGIGIYLGGLGGKDTLDSVKGKKENVSEK